MTTATKPDVQNHDTWEDVENLDFRMCPTCLVPIPDDHAQAHIEAKHQVMMREAIMHGQPEGIVKDFILKASYDEQIAALHSRQYWEQDEVERALGAIYAYQCTGLLAVLESTWNALNHAAVAWRRP